MSHRRPVEPPRWTARSTLNQTPPTGSPEMPRTRVDVVDDTFIRAAPADIRARFDDEQWLRQVWPHLDRTVVRDRGVKGIRWQVAGAIEGEMEVWIEPYWDGAIVHHYLRGTRTSASPRNVTTRHTLRWKHAVHGLKDSLEGTSL